MPEKTQYICSILHDHDMTIQWKFTILHQKMRFLTSENIMYGTRWLCFKTDEKKLIRLTWCWKGRCHYWKIGKLPRRQLFFYIFKLKHSWGYRRTWGPSRIYIYIYMCIYIYIYTHIFIIYVYIYIYIFIKCRWNAALRLLTQQSHQVVRVLHTWPGMRTKWPKLAQKLWNPATHCDTPIFWCLLCAEEDLDLQYMWLQEWEMW